MRRALKVAGEGRACISVNDALDLIMAVTERFTAIYRGAKLVQGQHDSTKRRMLLRIQREAWPGSTVHVIAAAALDASQ